MQYMGGKARICRQVAEAMLSHVDDRSIYLEPFVGGAYVLARMAPHFKLAMAGDAMPDLIMYWQAVQAGWLPPEWIDEDTYRQLRNAEPSALRAFAGFGCSFGGKWFGGYGRQKTDARHPWGHVSYGSRLSTIKKIPAIQNVLFDRADYREWQPVPGAVIYCDPPYAGTTAYGGVDSWDAVEFWTTAEKWAVNGCHVFVSEYSAPDGWDTVWSRDKAVSLMLGANNDTPKATEKLFRYREV